MTNSELVRGVRVLLHDTLEGYSTDNYFYPPDEVVSALDAARMDTYRHLIFRPAPAYITCSRMIVTAAKTNGATVPTDLYLCICGYKTDGTYIPYSPMYLGDSYADTGDEQVYIAGGIVYGTMNNIEYWKRPSDGLTPDGTLLTEFSDGFFHAVKYAAARDLLIKENTDSVDRWTALDKEYQRKLASFV